jgi:hypothetical protein
VPVEKKGSEKVTAKMEVRLCSASHRRFKRIHILLWKLEGKRRLVKRRHKPEDDIKMDVGYG